MAGSRADRVRAAREALESNRANALRIGRAAGEKELRALLERAARDLERRIGALDPRMADETFTAVQLRATLKQVELVLRDLTGGMRGVLMNASAQAAGQAAAHTVDYLETAERAFRGAAAQPLALNEARMINAATMGADASLLRRIASGPKPGHARHKRHAKRSRLGVLQRYGVATLGHFEKTLQVGLVARKSRREMVDDITADSPFLQGAPRYWAERIVRTEVHSSYGRGALEATKAADEQLGDLVKIASGVFDERTGADSFATHGQIRFPNEDFESWYGPFEHPADRPNDRSVLTTHRISWPIPPYLKWRTDEEILNRWRAEGRKGPPPPRPLMTTVPLERFGK